VHERHAVHLAGRQGAAVDPVDDLFVQPPGVPAPVAPEQPDHPVVVASPGVVVVQVLQRHDEGRRLGGA
jgi:hypothetical protein